MSLVGSGTLIVKPLKAKLTRDTEFLGKMDPYCKVILGNQQQRTREHTDAGINELKLFFITPFIMLQMRYNIKTFLKIRYFFTIFKQQFILQFIILLSLLYLPLLRFYQNYLYFVLLIPEILKQTGKHPSWNQSLSFRRTNEYIAEIQVWDSDEVSQDDLIGESSIALQTYLVEAPKPAEWINLSYKGKSAGQIYLQFEWFADSKYQQQPQIPSNPQYYQQNNVIPMKPPGAPGYQQPYNQSIPYQQPPNYPPQQVQYPQQPPYAQTGLQGTLGYPQNPQQNYPQQGYNPPYPPNQQSGYQPNTQQGYPPNQPPNYPPNQASGYPPNQPPSYPPNQPPNYPSNQPPNQPPNYLPNQPPVCPQNQPINQPPNLPPNQLPNQQVYPNFAQTMQNNPQGYPNQPQNYQNTNYANPAQNQQPCPNNQPPTNYQGGQPQNYPNNQQQGYPNNQMAPNQQPQTLPPNQPVGQQYPNQPPTNQAYPNVPPGQQPPPQQNYVPPQGQQQPPAFYPGQTLPQNHNYPAQTLPLNFDPNKISNPMGN